MIAELSRRALLRGAAGSAAGLAFFAHGTARAASPITVTTFGGAFEKAVRASFVPCFEAKTGGSANLFVGSPPAWISQIVSSPASPPIDVLLTTGSTTVEAINRGILEPITVEKVPNLAQIPEQFYKPWDNMACSFNAGVAGILYNKNKITNPPRSWKEFFDRTAAGEFGRRVAIPSIKYNSGAEFLWTIAHTYGGGLDNMDVGFEKVRAMKPYIVKFWTTPDEPTSLASTNQVDILVFLDGRAWTFIDGGATWANYINPAPGPMAVTVDIGKVKNASNLAWDYLNCMLSADAGLAFSKSIGYPVTNKLVQYPEELRPRLADLTTSIVPPTRQIHPRLPQWLERWNKEIGA